MTAADSNDASGMQQPVCSVCIANYNGVGIIEDCLDSVLAQSWSETFEIIVHDDASSDASVVLIQERYPQVRLLLSEKNVGFCVSNNRMVEAANGKYVLLLNNDAALLPNALQCLYEQTIKIGQPAILGMPQYDFASHELLDIGNSLDPFLNPIPNLDTDITDVALVAGACLWVPKKLWVELGGFPSWFGSIGEDLYLCSRARLQGVPVRTLNTSGYRHRVGNSFGGGKVTGGKLASNLRRRALSERNKTFVMFMCYPTSALLAIFPVHLLLLHLEGLILSLLTRNTALWREVYAPVLPAMWRIRHELRRTRRAAQKSQSCSNAEFFAPFHWTPWKLVLLLRHGIPRVK